MKLLLDTHAFLWWVRDDRKLSRRARKLISDPRNERLLSVASCWEIALLEVAGKIKNLRLDDLLEQLAINRIKLLDIKLAHVAGTTKLPLHHYDPFDRLLIAQATADDLTLVTGDELMERYGVSLAW